MWKLLLLEMQFNKLNHIVTGNVKDFYSLRNGRTITERRNRGFSLHELEMIKNALRELSAVKITERINAIKELRESL